jgi:SAM-dependent methyltransferase
MRLGFAIAATMNPDVLLLDEIFAVGDADFQRQCMATLESFQSQGKTLVFVSHSSAAVQAMCKRVCLLDHGRLLYDGSVEQGFAEYRRVDLLAPHEALGPEPGPRSLEASGNGRSPSRVERGELQDPDLAWHRMAGGGKWSEEGAWVFEFLTRQGLRPEDYVLEMGCGSLSAARHFLKYMQPSHYWGFERSMELFSAGVQVELPRAGVASDLGHFLSNEEFDLKGAPYLFDVAISSALFRQLPLNHVARVIASVVRKLKPGGRYFATWTPNPDPASFAPIVHADGTTTYSDREPYHYPFEMLASIATVVGARAELFDDSSHPRGESVVVFTRAER